MNIIGHLTKIWPVALLAMSLQGCATTAPLYENGPTVSEFSGENLDLLFATEFPVVSKDEALLKAARAYRDGELGKAQFYLVQALKFDMSDADLLAQIANLHMRQGNGTLAARAFRFAIQQDPAHVASLEGLGLLYFKVGNDTEAQKHLELAVAITPKLWQAHNALGVIADHQQNFELAQRHYNAALEIQPGADSILINRGFSKYLNMDYDAAVLDFHTVTERSDNDRAWRNLALVYGKQGSYEAALDAFLRTGEVRDAYNETGAIAMGNGDAETALRYLNEAVRISPTYFARAEKNLALLHRQDVHSYVN